MRVDSSVSGNWVCSLSLVLFLFLAYTMNSRLVLDGDAAAAMLLSVAMIRGDGPFLDRFDGPLLQDPLQEGQLVYVCTRARGHIVSRYPLAPALLVLPIAMPQVLLLDRFQPGWERDPREFLAWCTLMAKASAAVITAVTAVGLLHLLRGIGLGKVALPTALAAALGTSLWTTASQSLWQHGPAALALTLSMILLLPREPSRARLFWAGGTTAMLVACRGIDLVFALAILLYVARYQGRKLAWFLPLPLLVGGLLLAYNTWCFGSVAGGQTELERLHRHMHDVDGPWSGNLLDGAMGTLLSPSRGLFVFSPWIALALASLPATARTLRELPLNRHLLWSLIPFFLLLSKYAVWWGGHCFGPRYWTDAVPIFAVLLGLSLDWALARCRPLLAALGVSILVSVAVQALGAFRYTGSWDFFPNDVDHHHERLWDWRDSVVTRCLTDGPGPRRR